MGVLNTPFMTSLSVLLQSLPTYVCMYTHAHMHTHTHTHAHHDVDESAKYCLYAMSNHSGTAYGGHYTALSRHVYSKKWYNFNDSQ